MVRFIINMLGSLFALKLLIYIPIWLDLLSEAGTLTSYQGNDLHSNMVRFIIKIGCIAR